MEQKIMSSNDDILDLLVEPSGGSDQNGVYNPPKPWPGSRIETNENDQQRKQGLNKRNHMFTFMSKEELKIRSELEKDIERDLEEEIKDEIYHMALKLHRLYTGKNAKERNHKTVSVVNISIRLDGGTKIEIKETKKQEATNTNKSRNSKSSNPQTMPAKATSYGKKFDWEKSLRSGKNNPVISNKRSERSTRANTPSSDRMSIKGV